MAEATRTPLSVDLEPVQLIRADGTPTSEGRYTRDLPPETLGWLYEMMVVTRGLDGEFINLQRQGELALFASCRGQEAAQIGATACLRKTDWLFPQYREIGAFLLRGVHQEMLCADRDPHRHPRIARGGSGDGRAAIG